MAEMFPLEIVEERELAGPAATLTELLNHDDEEVAKELSRRLMDQGIAVPGDRKDLGLVAYLMGLLRRLRGRRLVRDLGVHKARLQWLSLHAPPGGTAHLKLARAATGEGGIILKFMGLGYGSGLEFKTTAEHDFGKRGQCFTLGSIVKVQLREYAEADADAQRTVQVDVVERIGTFLDSHERCPKCFTAPETGPQPRRLERTWDLTGDPHGLTEKWTHELTDSSEVEVGLDLPVLAMADLTAGIAISRSVRSTCEASYVLPGGARFSTYCDLLPGLELPFWGRD
jgi:hypothetical protein